MCKVLKEKGDCATVIDAMNRQTDVPSKFLTSDPLTIFLKKVAPKYGTCYYMNGYHITREILPELQFETPEEGLAYWVDAVNKSNKSLSHEDQLLFTGIIEMLNSGVVAKRNEYNGLLYEYRCAECGNKTLYRHASKRPICGKCRKIKQASCVSTCTQRKRQSNYMRGAEMVLSLLEQKDANLATEIRNEIQAQKLDA